MFDIRHALRGLARRLPVVAASPRFFFMVIVFATVLYAIAASPPPARTLAQNQQPPPDAVDGPMSVPASVHQPQALQSYVDADGYTVWQQNVDVACSYTDYNLTLNVDAEPKDMSDVSYTMGNYDVDYRSRDCKKGPEVDLMYLNGQRLGMLTGANNSWSINQWPLDLSQVISGSNTIYIDTDATNTGCWCVGVSFVKIRALVQFSVTGFTPADEEKNRDYNRDAVDLSVTLSRPYDSATVNQDTVKLEYRGQDGAWQSVPGNIEPLADDRFRFRPAADLMDGIRYRVTIRGGPGGVRSIDGATLALDKVWTFWTIPNLDLKDNFDYGDGTGSKCPPSASPCPGLEITVFQVARNATMVPKKEAMARLYMRWKRHSDVFSADQVKSMSVLSKLTVDGYTYVTVDTMKRPDQYTESEVERAANTTNILHRPIAAFNYKAVVQPMPQSNAVPVEYTNFLNLPGELKFPTLNIVYFFLKDGDWKAGVPYAAKAEGVDIFNKGVPLVEDQFPVTFADYTLGGEFTIGYTRTVPINGGTQWFVNCPGAPAPVLEVTCVFQHLATMRRAYSLAAATAPSSLAPGAAGIGSNTDKALIHLYGKGFNADAVVHEMGHAFGISTANNPTRWHRNDSTGVEGFQVRTGVNHSHVENPDQAISTMITMVQPLGTTWIDNRDYATLLGTLPLASAASNSGASLAVSTTDYLIVSGYVNTATATLSATTSAVYRQSFPNDPLSSTGPCQADLRDPVGSTLSTGYFDLNRMVESFPPSGAVTLGTTDGTAWQPFSVSLPWSEAATSLGVSCNAVPLLTVTRTAHAPAVSFASPAAGATASGVITVTWSGSDADGGTLSYQLQVSDDNGASWSPLTPLGLGTSSALDTTLLPSGGALLRVLASDGFNTSFVTRSVSVSNPLTVSMVLPAAGEQNVSIQTDVRVRFVSSISPSTLTSATMAIKYSVLRPTVGEPVYDPQTHEARLIMAGPLRPDRTYTVQLLPGITDLNGHALTNGYTWTFRTAPDTTPPSNVRLYPPDGEWGVPRNTVVQADFDEPISSNCYQCVVVTGTNGVPVPGVILFNTYNNGIVFSPTVQLSPNTTYTATVPHVSDEAFNQIATPLTWSFTTGQASTPTSVHIIGNYLDVPEDTDGDGLYDRLTIFTDVEVHADGMFNLNARLVDRTGALIDWASTDLSMNPGVYRVPLVFSGTLIGLASGPGPLKLESVSLYRESYLEPIPTAVDSKLHAFVTQPYDPSEFVKRRLTYLPLVQR